MSHLKLSVLLIAVLAIAPYGQAALPNLVQNPRFTAAASAEPNSFSAPWFYFNTATATTAIVTKIPGGGVRMESINDAVAKVTTTDRGLWQAIPVVAGATYQVNASWKGFLNTDGATGTTSLTSWNIYVAFGTSPTGPWTGDRTLWYKRLAYNRQIDSWNVPLSCFVPSAVVNYSFPTFENANISPATNQTIPGDAPLVIPAGMTHMRLRLGFWAGVQPVNSGGVAQVIYDEISVTACQGAIAGDVNNDCKVTFADFAIQAANWLVCGLTPASFCP